MTSLATPRYWSALPTRYGDYAARYSLSPVGAAPGAMADTLRGDLAARLAAGPLRFTLSAQLYVDPVKTPIEDASVDWDETISPYVPSARIGSASAMICVAPAAKTQARLCGVPVASPPASQVMLPRETAAGAGPGEGGAAAGGLG